MATEAHATFCRICEAACGLRVHTEEGRVADISPDPDHPVSRGYACIKGVRYGEVHASPDRVTHPLRRLGNRWERATWDEALEDIGRRLRRLRGDHGPDSIGMYVGNPVAFGALHPVFAHGFMRGVGSRNVFGAGSQDCNNKFAVSDRMYGSPAIQPIPDLDRTRCLIVIGSNPAVSHMSFVQVPRPIERLRRIETRGGRVFFVNPRRTESARMVGTQVFIRPDTDVFFLLGFLRELIATGGVDHARVRRFMRGFDDIACTAAGWTPERQAEVTGIPPDSLREMVDAYRRAASASLYCSTGVNQGSHGTLAFWILNVINAVSGNLDREGGALVSRGLFDLPRALRWLGFGQGGGRSRVGGFAPVLEMLPAAILPDEVETPGPGQLRGMIVTAGNPLLSCADETRMRRALGRLELLVCIDLFRNETGNLAHWILPAVSFLERPDLPIAVHGMQPTPYLQYTPKVVEPAGEARDEWWIFAELAHAAGIPLFGSRAAEALSKANRALSRLPRWVGGFRSEAMLLAAVAALRPALLRRVLRHPSGVLLRANRGDDFLGRRVLTKDGLVDLAPPDLVATAERVLDAEHSRLRAERDGLVLISKRERFGHNSWMHNVPHFVRGERGTNYLHVHSEDARRLGLEDGSWAEVTTGAGSVRAPVRVTDDLVRGTVAMPHGWGHAEADGLRVARDAPGANPNRLAPSGPAHVEPLSGMTRLNGIPVTVRPAAVRHLPRMASAEDVPDRPARR